MKKILILIFFLCSLPVFAQKDGETVAETPLIDKAEISISTNYRQKTTRNLPESDIPTITYSTAFYSGDFTFSLDYGSFPFKGTDQRRFNSQQITATVDFFEPFGGSFFFMANMGYTYYTDKTFPQEFNAFAMIGANIWKFSVSSNLAYNFIDSYKDDFQASDSKQEWTPALSLKANLPYGFYLQSAGSYAYHHYFNMAIWDTEPFRIIKHTLTAGFFKSFPALGFRISGSVSREWNFKARKSYPFKFSEVPENSSAFLSLSYNLTKEGDISVALRLRSVKTQDFSDFYIGTGINLVIN